MKLTQDELFSIFKSELFFRVSIFIKQYSNNKRNILLYNTVNERLHILNISLAKKMMSLSRCKNKKHVNLYTDVMSLSETFSSD